MLRGTPTLVGRTVVVFLGFFYAERLEQTNKVYRSSRLATVDANVVREYGLDSAGLVKRILCTSALGKSTSLYHVISTGLS